MSPGLGVKKRGSTSIPNDGGLVPQTLHIFKPTKSPTGAQNQAGLSVIEMLPKLSPGHGNRTVRTVDVILQREMQADTSMI